MLNGYQSGNLLVDEIDFQAQLLQNKVVEILQAEFAREINRLVYEEARRCCEGCEINDPSQLHHECMIAEEEEIWIRHYESAKEHLNIDKLWTMIEKEIFTNLEVYLQESWLKYILNLLKMDETSAFLLYKDAQQREDESEDECLRFKCFDCVY